MKKIHCFWMIVLILLSFGLGVYAYSLKTDSNNTEKNVYDYSFSEVVNYVNNIENYLAKAMISKSSTHSAETLSKIWSDSNLAIVHFENIPFVNDGSNKAIKFLNQISDYSYTLMKKSISGKELVSDDFDNLKKLYEYSTSLKDVLNELSAELNNGTITWKNLNEKTDVELDDVNIFSSIESNFDDYEGLIYDGAYSDFVEKDKKLGLTGDDIDEATAQNKVKELFKDTEVEDIKNNGQITGDGIECYSFTLKTKKSKEIDVEVSKKGGWIVQILSDKDVEEEKISQEDAIKIGKDYLEKFGYSNMKETYYTKKGSILTINYAYSENQTIMYPDLIKVKIALDDGKVLGLEAAGYLNNHQNRNIETPKISLEEAKNTLNPNIEIISEGMAIIPLDNSKEVYCYEFKGKVENKQFLVYINAITGDEEEILVILETGDGTLTI